MYIFTQNLFIYATIVKSIFIHSGIYSCLPIYLFGNQNSINFKLQ